MQRRNNTVVPLGMLRRFLGASVFSIVVTSFFFVHVHVSPSPSDHIGGYILCGTSRGYIYLGLSENKRGYISCGSVLVEGTSTRFKENKGGYIPCGSLIVKGFLQG